MGLWSLEPPRCGRSFGERWTLETHRCGKSFEERWTAFSFVAVAECLLLSSSLVKVFWSVGFVQSVLDGVRWRMVGMSVPARADCL
jgi:hypothetical protein